MACAPGARHFCDIYAASTTQPTSKAIFTLPKLWPVRSDTAGKRFLVHAMLHPSLTCFFRMVDVLRGTPTPPAARAARGGGGGGGGGGGFGGGGAVFRIWWVQIPSFSRAAMRRQSHRMAMACSSSWTGGRDGAMRMLLSWGSTP